MASVLQTIVGDVKIASELVASIDQASQEQAQGIEQINGAVGQMDKITQQNAAGAEESASASEQLSAQAATLKGSVNDLAVLVTGRSGTAITGGVDDSARDHSDSVTPARVVRRRAATESVPTSAGSQLDVAHRSESGEDMLEDEPLQTTPDTEKIESF